jgi:hypothetical protein
VRGKNLLIRAIDAHLTVHTPSPGIKTHDPSELGTEGTSQHGAHRKRSDDYRPLEPQRKLRVEKREMLKHGVLSGIRLD